MKNPIAIIEHPTHAINEPNYNNVFLPITVKRQDVNIAAMTCSKLIKIGSANLIVGAP